MLKLGKDELAQRLKNGEKLQPLCSPDTYCIYNELHYGSPFRAISKCQNQPMDQLWNNKDWRVYEDPSTFWKPINGEKAWYVSTGGDVIKASEWYTQLDKNLIANGNVFKTEEDAVAYVRYLQAEQRLKEVVWGLNQGEAPEFVICVDNYTVCFDGGFITPTIWRSRKINPNWLWLKSIQLCEELIKAHKDDLLIYLKGV